MQKIRWAGYILIVVFAVALTTAFAWRPAPPARFTGLQSVSIPSRVLTYKGQEIAVDPVTKSALVSAEVTARGYQDPNGNVVQLMVIGGTDRSALHDPRSCLVGAGWKIDNDRVEQLALPGGKQVPARTCIATMTDPSAGGSTAYDILYLYVTHRRVIASATEIRLALLQSALLEQNDAPVYFVRLMAPYSPGAYTTEHKRLSDFAADLWRQLSPSMLKGENA